MTKYNSLTEALEAYFSKEVYDAINLKINQKLSETPSAEFVYGTFESLLYLRFPDWRYDVKLNSLLVSVDGSKVENPNMNSEILNKLNRALNELNTPNEEVVEFLPSLLRTIRVNIHKWR